MRLGDLRGKELIDRAAAEHLGIVYHVDATLDESTGQLLDLHLLARRGWFGGRQHIPWVTIEKVGRELVIVNLELADRGEPGIGVTDVRPDPDPPIGHAATRKYAPDVARPGPVAWPWPRSEARRRRRQLR